MPVTKFRKKPVIIEAIQFTNKNCKNIDEILNFCPIIKISDFAAILNIPTLEGIMQVSKNDWIIKGIKGEFYPCKPDIFESIYEKIKNARN